MSLINSLKRLVLGAPIATSRAHHVRLPVLFGLPVFASDAISSVAYATEEILLVLKPEAAFRYVTAIALAIGILIAIVVFSYRQTIYAYPMGGGGYRVSSDNLGSWAGRIAGAALLIDYVLTVAVSVSSGVLAIVSAFPNLLPYVVPLGISAIALMALVNLRGTKESGVVFAIPTYGFVALILTLITVGLFGGGSPPSVDQIRETTVQGVGLWVLLRAFAAGCTALTGIEAIADGAGAFRPPEAKNASTTLVALGGILVVLFVGVSWLSLQYGIKPMEVGEPGYQTVVAQISRVLFPEWLFYTTQIATMAILILAANTAFADFPRLCSFIAKDSFLPRQLANLGDRLVFQNGILLLAFCAALLIFFFHGDTHALIPLYAVGVFTSFTLSQAGMVVRSIKTRQSILKTSVSVIGTVVTGAVGSVILVTKFHDGAWLILVACSVLLALFWGIRRHYDSLARQLNVGESDTVPSLDTTVLILIPPRIHRGIIQTIAYARTLSQDCRAVTTMITAEGAPSLKKEWERLAPDIPLVILESPYRSLVEPVMEYIDEAVGEERDHMLTVIIPEAVAARWWQRILHNNSALPLKLALASRKNVVITNVRYFLDE